MATGWPRAATRSKLPPLRVVPRISGAAAPTWGPLSGWLATSCWRLQPARQAPSRTTAAAPRRRPVLGLGVGVEAGDPEVHGVQGEEDRDEADPGDHRRLDLLPAVGDPGVEVDGEDHPGDEGEGLLGVP